ncbi:MAG: hypothetical protein ETSY2_48055 [Candidatus Entotheonella gemina]|uniref:Glycosyltransferase subfamily 4-like N-terminal domain-containing protein n=1 Tax=Candidatus Entotheonella gemina TaxID=1429439 RepID=W4LCP5_9BACT|nr:MAG: hypothetical protein ETSY2_48055 [Candidatus Entotheonella gemina]
MKNRVGIVSGAPRVSTKPDAEVLGSRGRLIGIIKAFEAMDWETQSYIVGDRMAPKVSGAGSEAIVSRNFFSTLVIDVVRLILSFANARRSWKELGAQVDLVYESGATLQCLGQIFKRHGIPWVLQTEAPQFYEAKVERNALVLTGLAKWLEVRAYNECDVLVCITEAMREIVVHDLGIPLEKTLVVSNGVDTELFNPERYKPTRLFPNFTVGFVGMLYNWSGLALLLQATAELRKEGLNLSLAIVGDGLMRATWEAETESFGIKEHVAFVGRVEWEEVPSYIAGFDVGFSGQKQMEIGKMYLSPLKLYEYMSMAKPVVASAFADAHQLVFEGKTGFLFTPDDKDDLKRALSRAYHQREALHGMGLLARQEVVAYHSWTARGKKLVDGIEHILAKQASA